VVSGSPKKDMRKTTKLFKSALKRAA